MAGCSLNVVLSDLLINLKIFLGGSDGKASAYNVGDLGSIPGMGRSPGKGNGKPLQNSFLENPMDRGSWQATVHEVVKNWTRRSNFTFTFTNQSEAYCSSMEKEYSMMGKLYQALKNYVCWIILFVDYECVTDSQ